MRAEEVHRLKCALEADARTAAGSPESNTWLEPEQWKRYMGKGIHMTLYSSFSDEELLTILKAAAEHLGRNPNKKDVFCVYRVFLIRRFGNWPRALAAAGLKRPREQRREENRQKNENSLRQQEIKRPKAPRRKRPDGGQTRSTEETQNMMRL